MNKACFLDKDGTLIEDFPYNVNPSYIHLTPLAGKGLKLIQDAGYKLFIFSNQSGIARGYFTHQDLEAVFLTIKELLIPFEVEIDAFYFCPHHPQGLVKKYSIECDCRKPKTGLLKKAKKDFNLDLNKCWVIGDILSDVEAGKKAGARSILMDNGNETEWLAGEKRIPDYRAANLLDAGLYIKNNG